MNLVFFDIDGTLVRGTSTERRFALRLFCARKIGFVQLTRFTVLLLQLVFTHSRSVMKKNKAYLHELDAHEVADFAREWVRADLDEAWHRPAIERLREHRRRGDSVVLLSGTLDCIGQAIAERLGAGCSIGSVVRIESGRYQGCALLQHPFGEEKKRLAEYHAAQVGVSRSHVFAYGNSIQDADLLEWSGHPCIVNADKALARLAEERHWEKLH